MFLCDWLESRTDLLWTESSEDWFYLFFFFNNQSKMGGEGGLNWKAKLPANNKIGTSIERKRRQFLYLGFTGQFKPYLTCEGM